AHLPRCADLAWSKVEASASSVLPPPRWRHSATAISKTQLLVFGGFHSSTTRLNDLWVFDATTRTWLQPVVPTAAAGDAALYAHKKRKPAARGGAGGGGPGSGAAGFM